MSEAAFYCMSSAAHFLGAVGMINSLRLQGHTESIYLLDLGLTDAQRELLAAEATIVPAPSGTQPWLSKTIAPLAHPAETMILIDSDIIVTRPLGELLERGAGGGVVAFENDVQRFVGEWGELLDLGPVRPGPYVSSGLVMLGGDTGAEVLRLLDDRQHRVEFERSYFGADEPGYALRFLDQDVLNAVLRTRIDPDSVHTMPYGLMPNQPFQGLRILDERSLCCAYGDGAEPYAVHHFSRKPWIARQRANVYSLLLTRCLVGPGLALGVEEEKVPLRLRRGAAARTARLAVDIGIGGPAAIRRRMAGERH